MILGQLGVGGGEKVPTFVKCEIMEVELSMGVWLMLFIILEYGLAFQRSHRGKDKYIKDI